MKSQYYSSFPVDLQIHCNGIKISTGLVCGNGQNVSKFVWTCKGPIIINITTGELWSEKYSVLGNMQYYESTLNQDNRGLPQEYQNFQQTTRM